MIVDMYRDDRFKLDEMVSQVYDLPDWERAIHDLESGALARGVIQVS
jgi:Zn-dependent alcohol dehydrogenase